MNQPNENEFKNLTDEHIRNSKVKEAMLDVVKVVTKQQLHEIFKPVLREVISILQSEVINKPL